MINLTGYSEHELSLNVVNDESLYNELHRAVRRNNFDMLVSLIDECFLYTNEQLEELRNDFKAEVQELEEENK